MGLYVRTCRPGWGSADAHPVLIEIAVRLVIAGGQAAAAALATREEAGVAGFPDSIRLGGGRNFINPKCHHAAADARTKALDHGPGPGPDIQGQVFVQGSGSKRNMTAFSTRGEILPRAAFTPPFQLVPFSGGIGFEFNSDG